jgi:hypothetical protein
MYELEFLIYDLPVGRFLLSFKSEIINPTSSIQSLRRLVEPRLRAHKKGGRFFSEPAAVVN